MRLGLGLSLTARLMGSGANGAPLEIDGAAWLLEQVDGDPDAIGITWLGPLPDDNGTAITTVRRQRYALGTLWPEYHLKTGGGIPTVNQRYVSYADPGVVNDFWLYAQNGVGTPRKGTAKSITPWVALGAPAAFAYTEWSISPVPGTVDVADILITAHPNNPQGDLTGTFIDVNDGSGYGTPVNVSSIAIGVPYRITLGAGTFDVRIWDENGQTPVNKSTPKLVTPWVDTDEPPVEVTAPTITPDSGPAGTVFTLTYGSFSGSPDPTLTPTLLLGATDVTASIVTTDGVHTYTSATAGTLSLTVDATNTEGSIDSTTVTATVTAVGPTTLDLGGGYSLSDATGIIYEADPVNGYAVQYKATTSLLHSNKGGTVAAANVDVRNGAMFKPRAGISGYSADVSHGFDGRMVGASGTSIYLNGLNVSPQRTNADYAIPSVGSLVLATSSTATIPLNYTAQRSNRTVQSYKVVSFMSGAPTAGRFRPPVRGNITPSSNWTAAQVASRLDTIFPRDLTGFEGQYGLTSADIPILIAKLKEQPAAWALGFDMACFSPQSGTAAYGRDRTYQVGCAMLMMRSSNTSYITDAQRLELALGLVRHGLEWWGTVVDGGYFQLNGAATQGAMWFVLAAGLLLDDAYIMNSVLNPIIAESNPGLTLGYYPFTEQRNYMAVEAAARTTGSPEGVNWGNYVGSGGSSSGNALYPDSHPLDADMLGIPEWCIQSDRLGAGENSFHLVQKYRTPNLEGLCATVGALHDKIGTTHGGYNLAPLQVIADYVDRMSWCEDAIRTAKTAGMPSADATRFHPNGANWLALIPTVERTVYNACVPSANRYVGKPERPFAPAVSASGQDVTVTFHPIKATHGEAITSHKIYWTDDDWATSNTISGISGAATDHTFTATASSTIQVRHAIVTAQGESPKSTNQHNRQAANAGAGTGIQGTVLTGSNAITYAATVTEYPRDMFIIDSDLARGNNSASVPLAGGSDAPDGQVVQARLVSTDDGGVTTTAWQDIAIVSGGAGAWSGAMSGVPRSSSWYRAEVRVKGSSATANSMTNRIGVGFIVAFWGASNTDKGTNQILAPDTPPLETIGVGASDPQFFQWTEVTYGTNSPDYSRSRFVHDTESYTSTVAPIRAMAAAFHKLMPGLKVHAVFDSQSGSPDVELLSEGSPRVWAQSAAMFDYVKKGGVGLPQLTPVGAVYKHGEMSTDRTQYANWMANQMWGWDQDGAAVADLNNYDASTGLLVQVGSPPAYPQIPVAAPQNPGIKHTFSQMLPELLTGRCQTILHGGTVGDTFAAVPFGGLDTGAIYRMAGFAHLAGSVSGNVKIPPVHNVARRGMFAFGTSDNLHTSTMDDDGFPEDFRIRVWAILQSIGAISYPVPAFDVIQWNAGWLRLGSTTGPITTWARMTDGIGAANHRDWPNSQATGFWTGALVGVTKVEIRTPNPDGSPGALAAAGDIYIYPEAGQTFNGSSQIYWHLGNTWPAADDWNAYRNDLTGRGIHWHAPIVDVGLPNMRGIIPNPRHDNQEFINEANSLTTLFGVDDYTPIPATPVNMLYSFGNPTAPTANTVTIDAVIKHGGLSAQTRLLSVSSNASGGYLRVTAAGAVMFSLATSTASQYLFTCQTPNGVVPDGATVRIRVTAKRTSTGPEAGDVHCWVDTGSGLVSQDGGTPAAGTAFGSGLTWAAAGNFASGGARQFHIGQVSQTTEGQVGTFAVFAGVEYADTADHDPLTASLYVRANSAETGFEKWNGSAWVAL